MCEEDRDESLGYATADELFASPEPSSSLEEARKAFLEEANRDIIDQVRLRQQEDWNCLANLFVGAEGLSARER